jgi:hypothetical protein
MVKVNCTSFHKAWVAQEVASGKLYYLKFSVFLTLLSMDPARSEYLGGKSQFTLEKHASVCVNS